MKLFNFFLITLLLSLNTVRAMEADNIEYRTYQGTPIDTETIGSLAQPLPETYGSVVKEWRDDNLPLLEKLCDFSCENTQWREHKKNCMNQLNEQGLNNKSQASYIFELPTNNNLFVQIAGPGFRLCNIKGTEYYRIADHEVGKAKTYQTVSRLAYYLKWLEESAKHTLNKVTVPATYLVPLYDNQPKNDYSDDNCFIIQERVPEGSHELRANKDHIPHISSQSFKDLLGSIEKVGFWDIAANLLVNKNTNELVISDIEQPANEEPRYFFHQNKWLYENQIKTGYHELYDLCESDPESQRTIQDYVRNNVHLTYNDKQKELEQELKLNE